MHVFDPIQASVELKKSYIDYITTSFSISDPQYRRMLREQLQQHGLIAKGPYLDATGSFQAGRSIQQLIQEGLASPLFAELEQSAEPKKELKIQRPLYLHQEKALLASEAGHSLIVTTGTGSGKTECFLIPIIQHLLR